MPLDISLLNKPIKVHVCKDRTLSLVEPGGRPFNGVALPVYSVDTVEEGRQLIGLAGSKQYEEHPQLPGQPWLKINIGVLRFLELTDLDAVQDKLHQFHAAMRPKNEPVRQNS